MNESAAELVGTAWAGNRLHRVAGRRTAKCGAILARSFRMDFREAHSTLCGRCFTKAERHEKYLIGAGLR